MKQRMRIFGAVLCVYAMFLSGYMLYNGQMETRRGDDAYMDLQKAVKPAEKEMAEDIDPALPAVDFEALRIINSDIVAWIYSPGTAIDYPIVQGKDNQYYLKRLFDGTYNNNGCIFLDNRNAPDFSDQNSVIYGHHMKTEAMFSSIEGYKEQSYYEEHPRIYLITEKAVYRIELFAGIVKKAADVRLNFNEEDEFIEYIKSLKDLSTFSSDVKVSASDRIVSLSTCVYDFQNARYMLAGRLVPIAG